MTSRISDIDVFAEPKESLTIGNSSVKIFDKGAIIDGLLVDFSITEGMYAWDKRLVEALRRVDYNAKNQLRNDIRALLQVQKA